jgi:hypothetical protein
MNAAARISSGLSNHKQGEFAPSTPLPHVSILKEKTGRFYAGVPGPGRPVSILKKCQAAFVPAPAAPPALSLVDRTATCR